MLIKEKHVTQIIFHVKEKTCPRPSFQELIIMIYVKQTCSKSSYSCKELKDLHPFQYFTATLKLLTTCMKPDFLNTLLKEPDAFYVEFF